MKVHGYRRWSDQHQSRGSSLSRQTGDIEAFARELGWNIVEWITEDGVSASTGANLEKGQLGRFEKRVRAEEFADSEHCLMVERMDRLLRLNEFDAIRWFGDMVECGLTIALADKKMVVDRHSIRNQTAQLRQIIDDMKAARDYTDLLGTRVRAAWQTMRDGKKIMAERDGVVGGLTIVGDRQDVTRIEVLRGKRTDSYWVNSFAEALSVGDEITDGQELGTLCQKVHAESTCPAWLEIIENRTAFRIRPDICAIIETIFFLYVNTALGARGLAKLLNGWSAELHGFLGPDPFAQYRFNGAVPVLRDGRCWHGSTIKALLKNRAVLGEYEYAVKRQKNGVVVADYFPQIIPDALFQAANDRKLTKIKSNRSRTSAVRNLFSDVGRCFKCDSKLTFVTKRKRADGRFDSYAYCSNAYLNQGCAEKNGIRMIAVEDTVLDNLLELAMDDEHFIDEQNLPELRREVAEKRRVADDLQRQIATLMALIRDPSFKRTAAFDVPLRTAMLEEEAAQEALKAASERLSEAQGSVTPQEHVKRVSAIRADLWCADEAKGQAARLKVKMALNDLVEVFYVSAEHRQAVVVLKRAVRHMVLDWRGKLTSDVKIWRTEPADRDPPAVRAYFERMAQSKAA